MAGLDSIVAYRSGCATSDFDELSRVVALSSLNVALPRCVVIMLRMSANPVVATLETWRCQRHEALFDSARMGRSPMNWDVVVLRLNTDAGITGHATAIAARSS